MEITAKKISLVPLKAAVIGSIPCSILLKMFSVTTIPSSTTSPVARTIASSVRTFIEKPNRYIIKNEPISETGISISGRNAIIQFLKKRNTIKITSVIAMRSVSITSETLCLTNLDLSYPI